MVLISETSRWCRATYLQRAVTAAVLPEPTAADKLCLARLKFHPRRNAAANATSDTSGKAHGDPISVA
jgi:hypothetical protein